MPLLTQPISSRSASSILPSPAKIKDSGNLIQNLTSSFATRRQVDSDIESFYSDIKNTVGSTGRHAFLVILGDWNARLQTSALNPWVYSNSPNRNSAQFSDFLSANELFSSNTMFRKRLSRLYTHRGPQHTLSQIDHIVCRQKYRNSVQNYNAFTFRLFATDHRMVVMNVKLSYTLK